MDELTNAIAALVASSPLVLATSGSGVVMSASMVVRSVTAAARRALGLPAETPSTTAAEEQAAGAAAPLPAVAPAPAARVEGGPDRVAGASARVEWGSAAAQLTPEPTTTTTTDDPEDSPSQRPNAGGPDPTPSDACEPGQPAGFATSAAARYGWGKPNRVDDFEGRLDKSWGVYDGPGHGGRGRRTPDAVTVENGVLTITGDPDGNTAGMAWEPGQKYGRWEGRVKAPASDRSYNALLLLWPDAENWPVGGEVDFMEMSDHTRQETDMFLHYGRNNSQLHGNVTIDATEWHNWAVEWTPDHIAAFVDGKEWFRSEKTQTLPPGPMHLCIQLDWFPRGGSVTTSHMYVDWVRQYPLNAADPADDGSGSEGAALSAQLGLMPSAAPAQ